MDSHLPIGSESITYGKTREPVLPVARLSLPRGRSARIIQRMLSLTPSSRLGPHELLSGLSTGGRGEVYRARDTKIDRNVATEIGPYPQIL